MHRLGRNLCMSDAGVLMMSMMSFAAWAGAVSNASTENELSGCGAATLSLARSCALGDSDTSNAAIVESSVGGCSMRASGFSFLGVVGASAQVSLTGSFGSSGAIFSSAGGSRTDTLRPDTANLNLRVTVDIDKILLTCNIGATGAASVLNRRRRSVASY